LGGPALPTRYLIGYTISADKQKANKPANEPTLLPLPFFNHCAEQFPMPQKQKANQQPASTAKTCAVRLQTLPPQVWAVA